MWSSASPVPRGRDQLGLYRRNLQAKGTDDEKACVFASTCPACRLRGRAELQAPDRATGKKDKYWQKRKLSHRQSPSPGVSAGTSPTGLCRAAPEMRSTT